MGRADSAPPAVRGVLAGICRHQWHGPAGSAIRARSGDGSPLRARSRTPRARDRPRRPRCRSDAQLTDAADLSCTADHGRHSGSVQPLESVAVLSAHFRLAFKAGAARAQHRRRSDQRRIVTISAHPLSPPLPPGCCWLASLQCRGSRRPHAPARLRPGDSCRRREGWPQWAAVDARHYLVRSAADGWAAADRRTR